MEALSCDSESAVIPSGTSDKWYTPYACTVASPPLHQSDVTVDANAGKAATVHSIYVPCQGYGLL